MERLDKPDNPYENFTEEELYAAIRDLQMYRREIDKEYSLLQAVITKRYAERLGR